MKISFEIWFESYLGNTEVWYKSVESNTGSPIFEQELELFHSVVSLRFVTFVLEDARFTEYNWFLISLTICNSDYWRLFTRMRYPVLGFFALAIVLSHPVALVARRSFGLWWIFYHHVWQQRRLFWRRSKKTVPITFFWAVWASAGESK